MRPDQDAIIDLMNERQVLLDALQSAERWFVDYGDTDRAETELRNIRSAINKTKAQP